MRVRAFGCGGHRVFTTIGLCAALPVLIGVLLTPGPVHAALSAPRPTTGHWVYVPDRGTAVHVAGAAKRVDASVVVGSAEPGSPVLADPSSAYLADDDRVVLFGRGGVTAAASTPGAAGQPFPVETGDTAYLVYRTAGLVVRLGTRPVTTSASGPLGNPIVTPAGQLWTHRVDNGQLCRLTHEATLVCPSRVPAGHTAALAVLAGEPGFVDLTAGTWQSLENGESVPLGVQLPPDAAVAAADVDGRLAVVDPGGHRLLLVGPHQDVVALPLGDGRFGTPVAVGAAVAVLDAETGTVATFDARGQGRAKLTVPGMVRLTPGADGRAYADSTDGLRSVVVDRDGTLSVVNTTDDPPPTYQSPTPLPSTPLPPATVAVTTTETVPPAPETVTVTPTTSQPPVTADPPSATTSDPAPPPDAPTRRPTIDVLSATATGPDRAQVQFRVNGSDPVFCHVYFNAVERTATRCSATMTVDVHDLTSGTMYDIYVLGTNAAGTGVPGRRGTLRT
jgi:hypothetical protein